MSPTGLSATALMSPRCTTRETRTPRPAILAVDDDPVKGSLTAALAERLGCVPTRAVDGQPAVDAWGRQVFTLVVMACTGPN